MGLSSFTQSTFPDHVNRFDNTYNPNFLDCRTKALKLSEQTLVKACLGWYPKPSTHKLWFHRIPMLLGGSGDLVSRFIKSSHLENSTLSETLDS